MAIDYFVTLSVAVNYFSRMKSSSSSSDENDKSFTSDADDYVEYPVIYQRKLLSNR